MNYRRCATSVCRGQSISLGDCPSMGRQLDDFLFLVVINGDISSSNRVLSMYILTPNHLKSYMIITKGRSNYFLVNRWRLYEVLYPILPVNMTTGFFCSFFLSHSSFSFHCFFFCFQWLFNEVEFLLLLKLSTEPLLERSPDSCFLHLVDGVDARTFLQRLFLFRKLVGILRRLLKKA